MNIKAKAILVNMRVPPVIALGLITKENIFRRLNHNKLYSHAIENQK